MILESVIHSCDVSVPIRDFQIVHDWTYLLFEEFFKQGDLERQKGLPISMLCDRNTTNVAKSQPGFISFVTLPLFTALGHIMPVIAKDVEVMKQNLQQWKTYEETEDDKKVYTVKVAP